MHRQRILIFCNKLGWLAIKNIFLCATNALAYHYEITDKYCKFYRIVASVEKKEKSYFGHFIHLALSLDGLFVCLFVCLHKIQKIGRHLKRSTKLSSLHSLFIVYIRSCRKIIKGPQALFGHIHVIYQNILQLKNKRFPID